MKDGKEAKSDGDALIVTLMAVSKAILRRDIELGRLPHLGFAAQASASGLELWSW